MPHGLSIGSVKENAGGREVGHKVTVQGQRGGSPPCYAHKVVPAYAVKSTHEDQTEPVRDFRRYASTRVLARGFLHPN